MYNILLLRTCTIFLGALACTLLVSCTTPLVIGTFYDGMPKRFSKQLLSYAKFTNEQKQHIRDEVRHFHQWHQQTQLPLYAELMREIASQLRHHESTDRATVKNWIGQSVVHTETVRHCNPLNSSGRFLSQLNDTQVEQIANQIEQRQQNALRTYHAESTQKRQQRRLKLTKKWIKRTGVQVNTQQHEILKTTLARQTSLGKQRLALWQLWGNSFIDLLQRRDQRDFEPEVNTHIASLWNITQTTYPQIWQTNIDLWIDFSHNFLQLQPSADRQHLASELHKLSVSIDKIANKSAHRVQARC